MLIIFASEFGGWWLIWYIDIFNVFASNSFSYLYSSTANFHTLKFILNTNSINHRTTTQQNHHWQVRERFLDWPTRKYLVVSDQREPPRSASSSTSPRRTTSDNTSSGSLSTLRKVSVVVFWILLISSNLQNGWIVSKMEKKKITLFCYIHILSFHSIFQYYPILWFYIKYDFQYNQVSL